MRSSSRSVARLLRRDVAPPYRWYDAFVDAGWHDVLSRPALQLILAIARRVDRQDLETRIGLSRLADEARLSRSKLFASKAELLSCGLVERVKLPGRRTPMLRLILPVPSVPGSAKLGLLSPRIGDSKVPVLGTFKSPNRGLANRRDPAGTRVSVRRHQKTKEQLGEKTEEKTMKSSQDFAVRKYLEEKGVPSAATCWDDTWSPLDAFAEAVTAIRALPDDGVQAAALDDAAFTLSRRLQASDVRMLHGDLWCEDAVREVLGDAIREAVAP
jgi:hypothetical protein